MRTARGCIRRSFGRKVVLVAILVLGVPVPSLLMAVPAGAAGMSFTFLQSGFTQSLYGTAGGFFGGVAFAANGDPLVDFCAFSGSSLDRFDHGTTLPVTNGTATIHAFTTEASGAGCGLTNHPDGALYSNTGSGVVELDANTGAVLAGPFGVGGDALGIAVDPITGNLAYVESGGTIGTVNPTLTTNGTFSTATTGDFVDQIAFDPSGNYLFLSDRTHNALAILKRDGTLVQDVPLAGGRGEPDGIAFHVSAPQFVVTNDTDGTISRFDFPGNDFTMSPTQSALASGGFRGDNSAVGPDTCLYLTQDGTRFDDGSMSGNDSLVQLCPGFAPPPGVSGVLYAALGDSYSSGEGDGSYGWNSDTSRDKCHRSSHAYGPLLDASQGLGTFDFAACSGAITDDLFAPNPDNRDSSGTPEPAQMSALTSDTKEVTLTIGGDDAGFATVLAECIEARLSTFFVIHGAVDSHGNPSCLTSPKTKQSIQALAGTVHGVRVNDHGISRPVHSIAEVLAAIHQKAPTAHVYIGGYPRLFGIPPNFGPIYSCPVGEIVVRNFKIGPVHIDKVALEAYIRPVNMYMLNVYGKLLNTAIANAADQAGPWATFVDPGSEFVGHAFCEVQPLWFGELSAEVDLGGADVKHVNFSKVTPKVATSSFHPTGAGQRDGYEAAFVKAGL